MTRAGFVLLFVVGACVPEPELAVHPASLHDDVPPMSAARDNDAGRTAEKRKPTDEELRAERLEKEINEENVWQKARELDAILDREIEVARKRLSSDDDDE